MMRRAFSWAYILFLAVVIVVMLVACGGGGVDPNAPVERPKVLRADLQFGYYASTGTQPQETKGHVNFYHDMLFEGEQHTIDSIRLMQMPVMLGVQYWMYDARNVPKADGEAQLLGYLHRLNDAGVLKFVTDVYPLDEPDLLGTKADDVVAVNAAVRRAFATFGMRPRLSVIYGVGFTWQGVASYDDIGFDNYSAGSGIFYNGDYARLKGVLRADQKIWLVPGGADPWRQDPTQFINFAHGDPQVRGLINFVWFDSTHPSQLYGKGIRTNGMAGAYCRAGREITRVVGPC
jgi:hypothetical protein